MRIRSWTRKFFAPHRHAGGRTRYAASKASYQARLSLELLEERRVLSTFTVLNTLDDGSVGTLRWAVGQANSTAGADTIDFDSGAFNTARTINLTGTQLNLSDTSGTVAITGATAGVTVNAGGLSRVFQVNPLVTASISGLTITGGNSGFDYGGGVKNFGALVLANCTVSGNSGRSGSGVHNSGTITLTNCTVSGNSATFFGGGLSTFGTATLTNCTVSGNSAGSFGAGLVSRFGGSIIVGNTIVANNSNADNLLVDVTGGVISQGNNLIGVSDFSTGWVASDLTGSSVAPLNALLSPLGDYGGPTMSMALLPSSPAIDASNNALVPAGVTTDQRGLDRFTNGKADIGAFESQGFALTADLGSTPQTAQIGTEFANPLSATVTANNPVEPVDGGRVTFVSQPSASGAYAIFLDLVGRHRGRPGRGHRRARQCRRQLPGRRVRRVVRFVQPDQRRPGLREPGREYNERCPLPGDRPSESA